MKKIIVVLILIVLAFLFFGCDELETNVSSLDNAGSQPNIETNNSSQETQPPFDDSIDTGDTSETSCDKYSNIADVETCRYKINIGEQKWISVN